MNDTINFDELSESKICPECGLHAPKRQIENLDMCERCSMDGKVKTESGETLNPENNILDKWKLSTNKTRIASEGAI